MGWFKIMMWSHPLQLCGTQVQWGPHTMHAPYCQKGCNPSLWSHMPEALEYVSTAPDGSCVCAMSSVKSLVDQHRICAEPLLSSSSGTWIYFPLPHLHSLPPPPPHQPKLTSWWRKRGDKRRWWHSSLAFAVLGGERRGKVNSNKILSCLEAGTPGRPCPDQLVSSETSQHLSSSQQNFCWHASDL